MRVKNFDLLNELQFLEEENQGPLSLKDRSRQLGSKEELEKTMLLEEISWRQKSSIQWLKVVDKNTKFFHRTANAHRQNNLIESMSHEELHWDLQRRLGRG